MRFEAAAEIVRERSMGNCEVCGRPGTQTHHRQPRGMGGVHGAGLAVNLPSALVRACNWCHRRIESQRTWALSDGVGLLVPRPAVPADVPVQLHIIYGTGLWLLTEDGCYVRWFGDEQDTYDTQCALGVYSKSGGHVR